MNKEDFAAKLRNERRAAGFTSAKAFAETAGLTYGSYAAYEGGSAMPPLDKAVAIANTLGVSLDSLTGRAGCKAGGGGASEDEAALLRAYRALGTEGRAALRAEAGRLLTTMLM